MPYDRKNYGGIQGYSQKTPRLTQQQMQDDPTLEYKINATNQVFKKTYYSNSETVDGFAVEDSFAVAVEDLGSIYNLHQLVIQFSMSLKTQGSAVPKFVQAVRVIHTRDRLNTSLDTLKITEEGKQKKIAESTNTLCFFMDPFLASGGKIPKNARISFYFIDNKREYGLITNSNFIELGNFSGVPNPALDKFNGTSLTNYNSPGSGGGISSRGDYTNLSADLGSCDPYGPITPDNFIFCGVSGDPERKIFVHPGSPVCNYANPAFEAAGFKRFAAGYDIVPPKIMVTHWDVCHSTHSLYKTLIARGIKMGFGIERNGMIFQFANAAQAAYGSLGFNEGTVQCEINNPVILDKATSQHNLKCYGDEHGGRRVISTQGFSFPTGETLGKYKEIYDFLDPQYFSIGALWEAISYAYGITLQLPDQSWINWRPSSAGEKRLVHPYSNSSDPYETRRYIRNNYQGILFHHNVDIRENGTSGKIDIVVLDQQRILHHALEIRAQRKQDGTF